MTTTTVNSPHDPDALLDTLELVEVYGGRLCQTPRSLADLAELGTAAGFFNTRIKVGGNVYPAAPDTWLSLEVSGPEAEIQWMEAPSDILDTFIERMEELELSEEMVIDRIIRLAHNFPTAKKVIALVERQQARIDTARRKLRVA